MADDKDNRPNRPFIPEDEGLNKIKNIGRRYGQQGAIDAQERLKLKQAIANEKGLSDFLEENPDFANSAIIKKGIADSRKFMNTAAPRIQLRRDLTRERAIRDTMNTVEREFSDGGVSSQVREMGARYNTQSTGIAMAGRSQKELEEERSAYLGQINKIGQKTAGLVQNQLYDKEGRQDPNTLDEIKAQYRQKRSIAGKIAGIDYALKTQRAEGLDEESQDKRLLEVGQNAKKTLFSNQVAQELRSGQGLGAMNLDQLKQKEVEQARAVTEALEKLKNASGESAESIVKLKEEARDAADNLEKTKEAIRQGGPGGTNKSLSGNDIANMMKNMLTSIGSVIQEVGISQPLQTISNRASFAQLSNQLYNTRNSAIKGDMTSLLNASPEMWQQFQEVGNNFASNQRNVLIANAGAATVDLTMNTVQAVKAGAQQANPIATVAGTNGVSDLKSGISGATLAAAQLAGTTGNLINESATSSAKLAGIQGSQALGESFNYVRGDIMQHFYNYSMGARTAALSGGGSVGKNLLRQFSSDTGQKGGLLSRINESRIDPSIFMQMASQGAAEQGSVFDTNQIFAARNLEKSGFGSIEQNMRNLSTLSQAGSNNPQAAFGSVLELSFSKALDNSKALSMVVENTGEMSRKSVGGSIGLDVTKSAASRLVNYVDTTATNKEASIRSARSAADIFESRDTSTDVSFMDMFTISKISSEAGISRIQAKNFAGISSDDLSALSEQINSGNQTESQRKKIVRQLSNLNISGFINNDGSINVGAFNKAHKVRQDKEFNRGAVNYINAKEANISDQELGDIKSGKISIDDMESNIGKYGGILQQIGNAAGSAGVTTSQYLARITGNFSASAAGKSAAIGALSGKSLSDLSSLDRIATASGADSSQKALLNLRDGQSASNQVEKLSQSIDALVKNLNKNTVNSFESAASKSALDFENSAKTMFSGAKDFKDAVEEFKKMPTNFTDALVKSLKDITAAAPKSNSLNNSNNKIKLGPGGGPKY